MGVTVTSQPAVEPVSLDSVKDHLGIARGELGHDAHLTSLIKAARLAAEKYTRRALITQTRKLTLDHFPEWRIYLPNPPLQSVSSITYVDSDGVTQTVSSSLYDVHTTSSPGFVEPAYSEVWPTPRVQSQAVNITYVAGFGDAKDDIPEDIKQAIVFLVEWYFDGHGLVGPMAPAAKSLLSMAQSGASHGFYGVTR